MTAATVCAICSAVYPAHDIHTCTYENPHQEGNTNMQYPPAPYAPTYPTPAGLKMPDDPEPDSGQDIRLTCLRLAVETGMPEHLIATRATEWADFVLGTTTNETS